MDIHELRQKRAEAINPLVLRETQTLEGFARVVGWLQAEHVPLEVVEQLGDVVAGMPALVFRTSVSEAILLAYVRQRATAFASGQPAEFSIPDQAARAALSIISKGLFATGLAPLSRQHHEAFKERFERHIIRTVTEGISPLGPEKKEEFLGEFTPILNRWMRDEGHFALQQSGGTLQHKGCGCPLAGGTLLLLTAACIVVLGWL